ncbi:MAG: histidine phosphatase family protein [Gammaproteobacteria bacterium]|nr:histidine phosphatase family protein [Gammaproteobacteria bacterium]
MKTVLFARHAKSNWNEPGVSDFNRPLNEKGKNDAPLMATYLQQCGYIIHQIISSDAARALATAEEYKKYLTPDKPVIQNHIIYMASHLDIVDIIKQLPDKQSTVMIVGHNPTMTEVVNYYTRDGVSDMPSCSVAIVQFEANNWSDIKREHGDLLAFEYPKKHN